LVMFLIFLIHPVPAVYHHLRFPARLRQCRMLIMKAVWGERIQMHPCQLFSPGKMKPSYSTTVRRTRPTVLMIRFMMGIDYIPGRMKRVVVHTSLGRRPSLGLTACNVPVLTQAMVRTGS